MSDNISFNDFSSFSLYSLNYEDYNLNIHLLCFKYIKFAIHTLNNDSFQDGLEEK
jgi:hypothetical protein